MKHLSHAKKHADFAKIDIYGAVRKPHLPVRRDLARNFFLKLTPMGFAVLYPTYGLIPVGAISESRH